MTIISPLPGRRLAVSQYYPVGADCVLYLDLGDGLESAEDHSIYGNDGTVIGATFVENGLSFDNVDDRMGVAYSASLQYGTNDDTMYIWCTSNDETQDGRALMYPTYAGCDVWPYMYEDRATNRVRFGIYHPLWTDVVYYTASETIDDWTVPHLLGVHIDRSAGTKISINGAFSPDSFGGTKHEAALPDGVGTIYHGGSHEGGWFNGIIHEILRFNTYKSDADVTAYFNATKARYGL